MTSPSDRSARAFAALAAALGITIGVAPHSLFAQSTARPSAVEQRKGAVQNKAQQNKAEQYKREQLEAQQNKAVQGKAVQGKAVQLKGEQIMQT